MKRLMALLVVSAAATASHAAIIPSWRHVPIPQFVINVNPSLANACTLSLDVELTEGSLFNVAGLHIDPADLPGVQFFNQIPFGGDTRPPPILLDEEIGFLPDLAFDTWVGTTTDQSPLISGKYVGVGSARVGTQGEFNALWSASPNTRGVYSDIARITFLNAGPITNVTTPVFGEVRSSDEPNVAVPIPPMPLPAAFVPEPAAMTMLLAVAVMSRCRRN